MLMLILNIVLFSMLAVGLGIVIARFHTVISS